MGIISYWEQHLGPHASSLQNYYAGSMVSNTSGPDWHPENTTKQQQQQQQQQRNEENRRYRCPKCGNGYKYTRDMQKHMRFQCGQEPKFQCPYCRRRSKVSSNMYTHVRNKHSDQLIYIIDLNKQSSTLQ
ncbi:zinc finger X-chromosomal protein-like [Monomorium pharaonis]|uniref:zinc finger X-chromosomal protein-like n=1 Tax=Monomorium pharaonis TaxID=307658 RepID=UPI001747A494|nr:zinc finger X-chromosomal protein-like [Monomorium pharaonis]